MAHGPKYHAAAQRMYLDGLSFAEIAEQMDRAKMHVNVKALTAWCKAENWKAAKEQALAAASARNTEEAVDRYTALLAEATKIKSDVIEAMREMPKPKSTGEGVNAFIQISRLIRELAPPTSVGGDAGALLDAVVKALSDDPKVKAVMESRIDFVREALRKAMAKLG